LSPSPASLTKVKPPLRLYGRAGCHLCEQMARTLSAFGVAFEELDVDRDAALAARFGERVPVLLDGGGAELCHGRLDPAVLQLLR
jgi:glutaredoxin